MSTAKQFIEIVGTIGNRTQSQASGDPIGANLRPARRKPNKLSGRCSMRE
ncbi:MAG: hypothetical protein ABSG59_00845 [Verrucomicrobiota bacterium]|jgi:hypothetical protein